MTEGEMCQDILNKNSPSFATLWQENGLESIRTENSVDFRGTNTTTVIAQ